MLNLSRNSNNFESFADLEIRDRFPTQRRPRHLNSIESPAHSRKNISSPFQIRQCPLKQEREAAATNLAVNILQYQLQDRVSQQHFKNLRSNLQYRLQVAIAAKNEPLITMLQQEFEQLQIS